MRIHSVILGKKLRESRVKVLFHIGVFGAPFAVQTAYSVFRMEIIPYFVRLRSCQHIGQCIGVYGIYVNQTAEGILRKVPVCANTKGVLDVIVVYLVHNLVGSPFMGANYYKVRQQIAFAQDINFPVEFANVGRFDGLFKRHGERLEIIDRIDLGRNFPRLVIQSAGKRKILTRIRKRGKLGAVRVYVS